MENNEKDIVLKKKKKRSKKTGGIFENKKTRYLYLLLCVLPLFIVMGVFGYIIYKDAKSLLSLAKGDATIEVKDEHVIPNMNYVLRDNATDVQKEYFAELKNAIENNTSSDEEVAGLLCKNFIADFYTWSNKAGQYDVGGLYYVYDGEQETTGEFKKKLYTEIRDTFYKYLSTYINEYGSENLLEVESVEVTSVTKSPVNYSMEEKVGYELLDRDESTGEESYGKIFSNVDFDTYLVTCSWIYKPNEQFSTSNYPTKMNFAVVLRNGRFEIIEMKEGAINVRKVEENKETEASEQE